MTRLVTGFAPALVIGIGCSTAIPALAQDFVLANDSKATYWVNADFMDRTFNMQLDKATATKIDKKEGKGVAELKPESKLVFTFKKENAFYRLIGRARVESSTIRLTIVDNGGYYDDCFLSMEPEGKETNYLFTSLKREGAYAFTSPAKEAPLSISLKANEFRLIYGKTDLGAGNKH